MSGYVYAARLENGWTKLGRSGKPERRLKGIFAGMPYRGQEVMIVQVENPVEEEKRLHQKYEVGRVNGEWFALSDAEFAVLCAEMGGQGRLRRISVSELFSRRGRPRAGREVGVAVKIPGEFVKALRKRGPLAEQVREAVRRYLGVEDASKDSKDASGDGKSSVRVRAVRASGGRDLSRGARSQRAVAAKTALRRGDATAESGGVASGSVGGAEVEPASAAVRTEVAGVAQVRSPKVGEVSDRGERWDGSRWHAARCPCQWCKGQQDAGKKRRK